MAVAENQYFRVSGDDKPKGLPEYFHPTPPARGWRAPSAGLESVVVAASGITARACARCLHPYRCCLSGPGKRRGAGPGSGRGPSWPL